MGTSTAKRFVLCVLGVLSLSVLAGQAAETPAALPPPAIQSANEPIVAADVQAVWSRDVGALAAIPGWALDMGARRLVADVADRLLVAQAPNGAPRAGRCRNFTLASLHILRGWWSLLDSRAAAAVEDLSEALRLEPSWALAYELRADAHRRLGECAKALADCDAALRLNPRSASAYQSRGETHRQQNDVPAALADFDQALRLNRYLALAYERRGELQRQVKNPERAIADLSAAIRLGRQTAFAFGARADAYRLQGNYKRALHDCDEALRRHRNSAYAYGVRGTIYRETGRYDLALADLNKALELNGKYAFAFSQRGGIYFMKREYARALEDLNEALRLDPQSAFAYTTRAGVQGALAAYAKAAADLEAALRISPQDSLTSNNLAWLLATCPDAAIRNGARAVELARQACERTGWKDGNHLDTLAAAYAESGDFVQAVAWQQKALALLPANQDKHGFQQRLYFYMARQAYRESATNSLPAEAPQDRPGEKGKDSARNGGLR